MNPSSATRLLAPRRCCCGLVLMGWALASLCAPAGAQTSPNYPSLFAAGSPNRFWIASVESDRDASATRWRTILRERTLPSGPWIERGTVWGRTIGLTTIAGDAAVLLEDGSWKRVGVDTFATGPAIPGSGPVLAWGTAPGGLLAVRHFSGGLSAFERQTAPELPGENPPSRPPVLIPKTTAATRIATAPATVPSISTRPVTAPVTGPAPVSPVLFNFEKGRWMALADLPAECVNKPIVVGATTQHVILSAQSEPSVIRTWALDQRRWADLGAIRATSAVRRFDLIPTSGSLLVWLSDQDDRSLLATLGEGGWSAPRPLPLPPGPMPPQERRAMTATGDELRLVMLKENKLWEQKYDLAGTPRGNAAELPQATSNEPSPFAWMAQSLLLLVIVLVLLAAVRRRTTQTPDKPEDGGSEE